jgi:MFS family permease
MAGITCFVIPGGIQTILFPWLITLELGLGADMLGYAQMSMQLPALVLILIGGLLADRIDGRRILIGFHLLAAIPAAGLAITLSLGTLQYSTMIVYALATGAIGAFIQPARDAILNRVAGDQLQRTVTVAMGLTFGAQIIGYAFASSADSVGAPPLLMLHASLMIVAAFAATRLRRAEVIADTRGISGANRIREGLSLVYRSERMRPATIILITMSMFYGGTFMVLNPIIVRDIYAGDAALISLSFGIFMLGTIVMIILLIATGGIERHGRGLVLAIVGGGCFLLIASIGLTFVGYLTCLFFWGMCGAVAMSMSRTIMQESAPEEFRARVMSIFSLANMGGMPVGAVIMGLIAETFGPLAGLVFAATTAMSIGVIVAASTSIWRLTPVTQP